MKLKYIAKNNATLDPIESFKLGSKFTLNFLVEQIDYEINKLSDYPIMSERRLAMLKMKDVLIKSYREITNET